MCINSYERNTKDRCMNRLENKKVGKEILFGVYEKICTTYIGLIPHACIRPQPHTLMNDCTDCQDLKRGTKQFKLMYI